jgi:hypothetical protein
MAIKTQDWNTFVTLTKARAGARLKDTELEDIGVLANAAARTINDYSAYWPRLLELQERTVDATGRIAYSEDSYEVRGAGSSEVNGLYVRNGDNSAAPVYTLFVDGVATVNIWRDGILQSWVMARGDVGTYEEADTYYTNSDTGLQAPTSGWETSSLLGEDPAPIVSKLDDIDEVITIWTGNKTDDSTVAEIRGWYASGDGISLGTTAYDTVYVGFKKDLTDVYGDGSGGTVSEVPFEWADYMSYSAARVLQDGQRNGEAYAGIALRQIDEVLNNQLMRVNRANAMNVFKHSLDTYFNNDNSTL